MKNPFKREPDFYVGGKENPYMMRWWIIPRNKWFNIYLHKFIRDDDDRALHDHPWKNLSIILKGEYIEHTPNKFLNSRTGEVEHLPHHTRRFGRFSFIYRYAGYAHRIELIKDEYSRGAIGEGFEHYEIPRPVWTLFITGPKIREWRFHCPQGWKRWQDFVDENDHGNTGKGCAE